MSRNSSWRQSEMATMLESVNWQPPIAKPVSKGHTGQVHDFLPEFTLGQLSILRLLILSGAALARAVSPGRKNR